MCVTVLPTEHVGHTVACTSAYVRTELVCTGLCWNDCRYVFMPVYVLVLHPGLPFLGYKSRVALM